MLDVNWRSMQLKTMTQIVSLEDSALYLPPPRARRGRARVSIHAILEITKKVLDQLETDIQRLY
jgi:hypothetical protein